MILARGVIDGRPQNFNYKIMLGQDQNYVRLTLKNYQVEKGLSTRIHRTHIFESKEERQKFD